MVDERLRLVSKAFQLDQEVPRQELVRIAQGFTGLIKFTSSHVPVYMQVWSLVTSKVKIIVHEANLSPGAYYCLILLSRTRQQTFCI